MSQVNRQIIVIDCSIYIAGIMTDESSTSAESILYKLSTKKLQVIVPKLFFIEAANSIVINFRRGRINKHEHSMHLSMLNNAPITVDNDVNITTTSDLALKHNLTIYDAVYLELTLRNNYMLATLDKKLGKAAGKFLYKY